MHKKVHKNAHSLREGEIDRTTSFGYWLRRRRKAPDLTQPDLTQEDPAQQIGYALDTIKKIETELRRPSKQLAERLADILQIGPHERIAGERTLFARLDVFVGSCTLDAVEAVYNWTLPRCISAGFVRHRSSVRHRFV